MGAKTWMLVCSDGDVASVLGASPVPDRAATTALVQRLFPGERLVPIADGDLSLTCPPDNLLYAGCFGRVAVLAAREFGIDFPSRLDPRFLFEFDYPVIHLHAMHSVVNWLAFAKWEHGQLIRSLSLSPDAGILEDVGERLDFERPYWSGQHPAVDPDGDEEYPFPFHPLDLGEAALLEFFGYQLEGAFGDAGLNPEEIPLAGYRRKKKGWLFG